MAANPHAIATSTNEMEMAGPAPARPLNVAALPPFNSKSSTGAFKIDLPRKCSPAAAVPVTVKIPEPITAPIPSAIKLHTPSDFLRHLSGSSDAAISASILLVRKSWLIFSFLVLSFLVSRSESRQRETMNEKRETVLPFPLTLSQFLHALL